jgi:hypothetical protein
MLRGCRSTRLTDRSRNRSGLAVFGSRSPSIGLPIGLAEPETPMQADPASRARADGQQRPRAARRLRTL